MDAPVEPSLMLSGFGGLRPLVSAEADRGTKHLLRDHAVEVDTQSGLVSLLGGKWTTYRVMAQDTVDTIARNILPNDAPCTTADCLLEGADGYSPDSWQLLAASAGWSEAVCKQLVQTYGAKASLLLAITAEQPATQELLVEGYPYVLAQVVYAVRYEMACTLRDVLARRIRLELLDWQATVQAITPTAHIMAQELGWTAAAMHQAIAEYTAQLDYFKQKATP
ncbi:MAG: glycerol-3-phosphate dehydrogenase C-terminal domain-containing protein [Saprospiraceae bacterium]